MALSLPILLAIAAGVGGCGGESSEAPPAASPAAAAAPEEVLGLTVLFVPLRGDETVEAANLAIRTELVKAGYKVVLDKRGKYDVAAVPDFRATRKKSMFALAVNGKEQVNLQVHLGLTLAGPGAQVVDQVATEFVTPAGEVSGQNVTPLITALSGSARVRAYVRERKAAHADAEQNRKEAAEAAYNHSEQQARMQEETDWNAAQVQGCQLPARLDGCDKVRLYMAKYKEGEHVEEAKKAIAQAEPGMAKLQKDENAWQAAGVPACRSEGDTAACAGVEIYATKFGSGLHADEARQLLRR